MHVCSFGQRVCILIRTRLQRRYACLFLCRSDTSVASFGLSWCSLLEQSCPTVWLGRYNANNARMACWVAWRAYGTLRLSSIRERCRAVSHKDIFDSERLIGILFASEYFRILNVCLKRIQTAC